MMRQPEISVIVPVYNVDKYLRNCVNSILSQTFTNFELLLINDGSTDQSGAICDELALSDHRVRVFHQKNGGVSSARNKGLDEAVGKWIYFTDSDDELYPYSLEYLYQQANRKEGTDLIIAELTQYHVDGTVAYDLKDDGFEKELDIHEALKIMYQPFHGYQGYLVTKLFKNRIIQEQQLRFNPIIFYNEDRLFCTQYICKTTGIIRYTTKSVYRYFERKGGAMNSIRNSFNYKFVTDFHAYILMSQCIHDHGETPEWLRNLSKEETINAYRGFKRRMKRFNIEDKQLKREIKKDLMASITLSYYVKFQIRKNIRKVKRRFTRQFPFFC